MRFVTLANGLGARFRHTVLAMDGDLGAAAHLDPAIDCRFAEMPVVKSGGISLANLRAARRLLWRERPDLLLTYNWGTVEWGIANRLWPLVPQIHFEDGFGPDESPVRQNPRRALTRRLLFYGYGRIIVPSRTLFEVATGKWHVDAKRVTYLPNGIDCGRFAVPPDDEMVAALGIDPAALVVGTVAALRREKNLGRLLRVFAALPERSARLVIVGDGAERAPMAAEATRMGIADRVIFTGAMTRPEKLIGRFDIFALTSDTEQMPISMLEAMAASRAVVATDVGDVRAILAAPNQDYVVDCADEAGFTAKLAELLDAPASRAALGEANRAHVAGKYALETMVGRYEELFRATISGHD